MCGESPVEDIDLPKVDRHLKASVAESFSSLPCHWQDGTWEHPLARGRGMDQMISKERGDCRTNFLLTEEERPSHSTPTRLTIPREWSMAPAASQGT